MSENTKQALLQAAEHALEDLLRVQSFLGDVGGEDATDLPTVSELKEAIARAKECPFHDTPYGADCACEGVKP